MSFVASENLVPILIALLIGFITGLWIWRLGRRSGERVRPVLSEDEPMRRPYVDNRPATVDDPLVNPRPEPEVMARRGDDAGDNGIASGAAAGVADVAGEVLGVDAQGELQGGAPDGGEPGDDLQAMKGVGPKLASLLRAQGLARYDHIAALGPDDLARLDAHLGAFRGRLARDRIVEQAALLARGDREGYSREFGNL